MYLDPNEAPKPVAPENPQSPEELKTLKMAEKLFKKAKNRKDKYSGDWLDHYRMFRGKQWKELRPSYRSSEVINLIFQSIQSTVPIQTDARPTIQYIPTEVSDY